MIMYFPYKQVQNKYFIIIKILIENILFGIFSCYLKLKLFGDIKMDSERIINGKIFDV